MPRLSLAKLERHLSAAADRLREGLDAATYKDYIFGLLFLKRCSDVFEGEREKLVGRKVGQGIESHEAEAKYGENPDFYDGFFVPEIARWTYLVVRLNDASEPYGSVLDKALGALTEHNETLEHVLDHISFMKVQSNKRVVSDDACRDLVRHFGRHRLRNEDFQFSDLLGAAYEFLINMFAESAGKKGGDFYTPRDVIRLMVRMLKPRPALGFDPAHAVVAREPLAPPGERGRGEGAYLDFAPALTDRAAIRPLIENDPGVKARAQSLRDALATWWAEHAPRLAGLPEHRQLNRVRAEFLDTFAAALLPLGTLDRFKLAGVIATWWTDTLPDFKTLLENGFSGVVDGWVDAIADAVEDDEAAGPTFDPFGHKLVRRLMADYLKQIAFCSVPIRGEAKGGECL